jgi:peptide/nickel transport system permease protein
LDFGESYVESAGTPVLDLIRFRLPVTLELALYGEIVGVLFGIPLGVISAIKQDTITDHLTRIGALAGFSIPVFYSGPIFILIFAQWLDLLPASGRLASEYQVDPMTGLITIDALIQMNFSAFISAVLHLTLPVFVLGIYLMALVSRMMRSTMLDELRQDYIQTARAKGQGKRITLLNHGFRNALIPVVTVIGLQFGTLLGGAVLTETIFGISGIGLLLVDSINSTDFPVVQGTVLVFALLFTVINLFVDLTYSYLDPRIEQ